MYQKDYILRMIEMLADLIASILGKMKLGKFTEASQVLENAYFDFLKQDAAFLQSIPKEELTEKLLNEHNYTNGHLEILAELFYVQGKLFQAQSKNDKSLEFFEKSLTLYEFLEKEKKIFSYDKNSKIAELREYINQLKVKI
jgi:hypothetical protein